VGEIASSSPSVAGGVVYVGSASPHDHILYAFDAAGVTGCSGSPKVCAPLWTTTTGGNLGSPAIAGGVVYVASFGDRLIAYSLPTVADATPPTVTLTTPLEGGMYVLGQVVNANYGCQDDVGGSGLASCVGTNRLEPMGAAHHGPPVRHPHHFGK